MHIYFSKCIEYPKSIRFFAALKQKKDTMEDHEREKLDSYDRVYDFNTKSTNVGVLGAIDGYTTERNIFEAARTAIQVAANIQALDTSGESVDSLNLKNTMAATIKKYGKKGGVKARRAHSFTLANQISHAKTFYFAATKTEAVARATAAKDALSSNLGICSNVTPANILEIVAAITAYDNFKDKPTEAIQTKKAHGTDVIPGKIEIADEAIFNMFELLESEHGEDNASLVSDLRLAKQTITTGHHNTVVKFLILKFENGEGNPDSNVHDEKTLKDFPVDDTFTATIPHHLSGHFHFTIGAVGRTSVDFAADIKQGVVNNFTVKLKLIPPPPPTT